MPIVLIIAAIALAASACGEEPSEPIVPPKPTEPDCEGKKPPQENVSKFTQNGEFDAAQSFPGNASWPATDVYVQQSLPLDQPQRIRLGNYVQNMRRSCGGAITQYLDAPIPHPEKHSVFMVDETWVGKGTTTSVVAQTYAAGEEVYQVRNGISPSWESDETNTCTDGRFIPHELAHHFQQWDIFGNQTYEASPLFAEGLAEYVRMQVTEPVPAHTLEEKAVALRTDRHITLNGIGTALRFSEDLLGGVRNSASISIGYVGERPWVSLPIADATNPTQDACRQIVWDTDIPKEFRGAYLCFFWDQNSMQPAGTLRMTTPAQAERGYQCGAGGFAPTHTLDLGDRVMSWNDLFEPYGNGEVGSSPLQVYGTGACFWTELEAQYGEETVKAIFKAAREIKMSSTLSISEWMAGVISKETGQDTVEIERNLLLLLENKFNLPPEKFDQLQNVSYVPVCE